MNKSGSLTNLIEQNGRFDGELLKEFLESLVEKPKAKSDGAVPPPPPPPPPPGHHQSWRQTPTSLVPPGTPKAVPVVMAKPVPASEELPEHCVIKHEQLKRPAVASAARIKISIKGQKSLKQAMLLSEILGRPRGYDI